MKTLTPAALLALVRALIFCLVLVNYSFCIASGGGMERIKERPMLNEIKQIRSKNRNTFLDITSVVEKYIAIGVPKEDAYSKLAENDFKIINEIQKEHALEIVATHETEKSLGFGDDFVIYITITNQRVEKVIAKIIYKSL